MAASALLEVTDLHAGYGKIEILHGVSLEVGRGEIVSLIGPNGAGKSTVFKAITGFLVPSRGEVRFKGEPITGLAANRVLARGLAYVPQGRVVFPQMTIVENLEMGAYLERDPATVRRRMERVFDLFPRLAERRTQQAGTMSGGEQQMLAIGRALMLEPEMVMLDEPSLGLSPRFVTIIFETLGVLRRAGMTLLVVEQNAARALAASDRAYVLELGRNRFQGTGAELLADPQVRRLYLAG
ncbi:MAG TPA: ABC transporter ATP-binding protein [Thermodesulfobacteriota bacterium]